ncbi:hypothetical protein HK097_004862, partial [Rhizophlyctis rosea]
TAAGQVDQLFQKLQKIDVETGLEPLAHPTVHFTRPDPAVADLIRLAEAKINDVEKANQDFATKNIDLENQLQTFHQQLTRRDQEITRLGVQLENARSQQQFFAASTYKHKGSSGGGGGENGSREEGGDHQIGTQQINELPRARARIEQLELQIEYLQEYVEGLEKESTSHESEKQAIHAAANEEKAAISAELAREKERVEGLLRNLERLEGMVGELERIKSGRKKDGRQSSPERRGSERKEGRCGCEEKIRAGEEKVREAIGKIDELTAQLRKVDKAKRDIEEEVEVLRKRVKSLDSIREETECEDGDKAEDDKTIEKLRKQNHELGLKVKELESLRWSLEKEVGMVKRKVQDTHLLEKEISTLQTRNTLLQTELDRSKSEVTKLGRVLDTRGVEMEGMEVREGILRKEVEGVRRERDELMSALKRFEMQIEDMRRQAEIISEERDAVEGLYKQVNAELHRTRQQLQSQSPSHQQPRSQSPSRLPIAVRSKSPDGIRVRQLEEDKIRLQARVSELEDELVKLGRDLKVLAVRNREVGTGRDEVVKRLEGEVESLSRKLVEAEKNVERFERRCLEGEGRAKRLEVEALDKDRMIEQARRRAVKMEGEREREHVTIRDLRTALSDAETRLDRLQTETARLSEENDDRGRVIAEQRRILAEVDRSRERDRAELDRKCERIVVLEEEVGRVKGVMVEKDHDLVSLRENVDILQRQVDEEGQEVARLRRVVEGVGGERGRWEGEAKRLEGELKAVSRDLEAVMRENGSLNGELAQLTSTHETLKSTTHDTHLRISYLEDLLQSKDRDYNHLLSQYRKIAADHERLETTLRAFSQESNVLK